MKKIIVLFLAVTTFCFSAVIPVSASSSQTVKAGYYNVESGKMEIGTAKFKSHTPQGYTDISYDVIDERTYKKSPVEVDEKTKSQLEAIAECTNKVFENGVNYSGTPIVYGNFGRVDSNAWSYSLTIAPLAVPMLEEKYGIAPNSFAWLCLGDTKGHVIRVYMEIVDEPVIDVNLNYDHAYIFGKDDAHMAPNDSTERQEACAMLYRLLKQNDATGNFKGEKTTAGYWSKNAIEYMKYIGMYDDQPVIDEKITRGEAFKLFCISLGYTAQKDENNEFYADILREKGYVVGDESGALNLGNSITRAEFCKIYNLITGRDKMVLVDVDGNHVTPEYYGIVDLDKDEWYYDIMLKATSSYTDEKVDAEMRSSRNEVDNY